MITFSVVVHYTDGPQAGQYGIVCHEFQDQDSAEFIYSINSHWSAADGSHAYRVVGHIGPQE